MAFTADEFLRGMVAAWLWFNVLFAAAFGILQALTQSPIWGSWWSGVFVVLLYAVPVALIVSGIVTLLCCGAAWALGRMLRRRRSLVLHAVCYALLGAAIGALVVTVYQLAVQSPWDPTHWLAVIVQACSAAAVALGWGWTVRHSIRVEAGRTRKARIDRDAAAEDAL
ncbi:hypothetical protein [Microbacterium cremeum]|uniref:hypothetical protein n=1 Tax=Microbacterium cremeum TaxID=2782169 RepID=UPI001889037D|nr:hypothetical protein [Microbacterium cremeum]